MLEFRNIYQRIIINFYDHPMSHIYNDKEE
jgi:hypothetical protein